MRHHHTLALLGLAVAVAGALTLARCQRPDARAPIALDGSPQAGDGLSHGRTLPEVLPDTLPAPKWGRAPAVGVHGVVYDPSGVVVSGAEITLAARDSREVVDSAISGPDGRFLFELPSTAVLTLNAYDSARRWSTVSMEIVAETEVEVEVRFQASAPIDLLAVNRNGEPVESYSAEVLQWQGHLPVARTEYPRLAGGVPTPIHPPLLPFTLQAQSKAGKSERWGPFDLTNYPRAIRFVIDEAPGIRGYVLAHGGPAAGASVSVLRAAGPHERLECNGLPSFVHCRPIASATTDATGYFFVRAQGLEPAAQVRAKPAITARPGNTPQEAYPVYIRVSAEGYAPTLLGPFPAEEVDAGLDVTAELTAGGSLRVEFATAMSDAASDYIAISRGDGVRLLMPAQAPSVHFGLLGPGPYRVQRVDAQSVHADTSARYQIDPSLATPYRGDCVVTEGAVTVLQLSD